MAEEPTPKYIEDFPLNDLTQQQFLALANETATKIGLKVNCLSENELIGHTDNAEVKIKIENGVANIQSVSIGSESEMIDYDDKNKKNIAYFIATFQELKLTLTKEELDTKYQELNRQLVPQEEDILKPPPTTINGFFITLILLGLNILIFILMVSSGVNIIQPDNESLLNWGANFKSITLDGEWWRLLTNCFLHIGILHLLMNMYGLLYIGILLEPHLGRIRFISAYLLTGIIASVASLWWHDFTIISAGASGAIFGMYGVSLAILTTNLIEKTARKALLISISVFVGYNLISGLDGNIDNAAHIGGLLGGFVIGYALIPSLKKPDENKLKFGTVGLLSIIVLVSSFVVYTKLPNDIGTYETKIKKFASMESVALEIYNMSPDTPKDKALNDIKNNGIYYWNESIKLIDSLGDLDLPIEIKTRNKILKEYCELRIKSYELLYKTISEETDQYKSQMKDYNQKIEEKVKELGS